MSCLLEIQTTVFVIPHEVSTWKWFHVFHLVLKVLFTTGLLMYFRFTKTFQLFICKINDSSCVSLFIFFAWACCCSTTAIFWCYWKSLFKLQLHNQLFICVGYYSKTPNNCWSNFFIYKTCHFLQYKKYTHKKSICLKKVFSATYFAANITNRFNPEWYSYISLRHRGQGVGRISQTVGEENG